MSDQDNTNEYPFDVRPTGREDGPVGEDALAYFASLLTPAEKCQSDFEFDLMREVCQERKARGLTQKQLGDLCGLSKSAIARIEACEYSPRLETVCKVLSALGKKIAIEDIA